MRLRSITRGAIVGAAAIVLALSGCASSAPGTPAPGGEGAASEASGQLTIYGPGVSELAPVFAAFTARYPDITVNPVKLVGQEIPTRLQSEITSGQRVGDVVFDSTMTAHGPWGDGKTADWWDPYVPAAASELPDYAHNAEQKWFAPYSSGFGLAYNSDAVTADAAPKTWEELNAPGWTGKLVLSDPTVIGLPAVLFTGLSSAGLIDDTWIADFISSGPTITDTSAAITQSLTSGEADVAVWGLGYVKVATGQGAPIAYGDAPTAQSPTPVAMIKDGPNPEAAKLLMDWLLTDEAQGLLAENGYIPLMPDQPLPDGITAADLKSSVVVPTYSEGGYDEAKRLIGVFDSLLP